jgi:hypothetical protein
VVDLTLNTRAPECTENAKGSTNHRLSNVRSWEDEVWWTGGGPQAHQVGLEFSRRSI